MDEQLALIKPITADDILQALRKHHFAKKDEWAYFEELRIGTGYGPEAEQRIDAWAIALFPSSHFRRIAYEIKTSRGDFLRELSQPKKRRRALIFSNEYYFVTPPDLVKLEEVPVECGLIELRGGSLFTKMKAPWRDTPPASWRFLASVARRAMKSSR